MKTRLTAAVILSSVMIPCAAAEPPGLGVGWEWSGDGPPFYEQAFIYVTGPDDRVLSVKGTVDHPLHLHWCPGHTFYQNPFGNDLAPNPALVAAFPSLGHDTFVSIGKMTSVGDFTMLSPNWPGFGDEVYLTDVGWFVPEWAPQAAPVNGRVFLGQFAADPWGTFYASFVVEVLVDGEIIEIEHSHASYGSSCYPGEEVEYDVLGEVISVDPELDAIAQIGDIVNGIYRFQDEATDFDPDPDVGLYYSNSFYEQGLRLVMDYGGSKTYQGGPDTPLTIVNGKTDSLTAYLPAGSSHHAGYELCFEMRLIDSTGTAFDSDSILGGDPICLSDFDSAEIEVWFAEAGSGGCAPGTPSVVLNLIEFARALSDDCNANGTPDDCEGFPDVNEDDINDWCQCLADLDQDGGTVGINDLLVLLGNWGPCAKNCVGDFDGDCVVGVTDLLNLLTLWGPCG